MKVHFFIYFAEAIQITRKKGMIYLKNIFIFSIKATLAGLVVGMDKFPQVPGSVIVQNFPSDWYYSDFVPVDGKINPISPQGEL